MSGAAFQECDDCGRVHPAEADACPGCGEAPTYLPTYAYECPACGAFELSHRMSRDRDSVPCPGCGEVARPLTNLAAAAAVVFKGVHWTRSASYLNGQRRDVSGKGPNERGAYRAGDPAGYEGTRYYYPGAPKRTH